MLQAKATGGSVSFYNNYTIHTFTNSGTFTMPDSYPSTPCFVLVVAGGDAVNPSSGGGGGGGGGLRQLVVQMEPL